MEENKGSEEIAIEEVQSMVIANMSLQRPINIDDIRYAVKEGFRVGKNYEYKRLLG